LTALTNDIGWENTFTQWLKESKLSSNDAILICSVGGGDIEHNVSMNIVNAIDYANTIGAKVLGIVGRNGGYTKTHSNACILIPSIDPERVTPHVEGISGVILHLIVSHPKLKVNQTKWESAK
jgi:D-sedoheptulose 7-phosphate isomerase